MANDLDDIRAQTDCPVCGKELNVPYRTRDWDGRSNALAAAKR
jgi:hypothetical protein